MKKVPYAFIVGSLMYVIVCTKLNITHIVGVIGRFLSNLGKEHWSTLKWILMYLKDTSNFILYFKNGKHVLDGYTNVDISGDVNSRKFISGCLMTDHANNHQGCNQSCKTYCIIHYRG